MLSSLFSSASALNASQTLLDVVGNDLANSNTIGFKSQLVNFSTQFTQMLQGATAPTATSGGTDPIQIGNGVQVGTTETDMSQGTLQSTGNPYDLAIQGNGFFVLNNGTSSNVFTRAGSFSLDSAGDLVDPTTGYKVQRTGKVGEGTATTPAFQSAGDANINVPLGMTIPGSATRSINFSGNLSSSLSPPVSEVLGSGEPLTSGGLPATSSTLLNSLDQTTTKYSAGDQIEITGSRVDGTTVSASYTLTGTSSDTVGSLLDAINTAFLSSTPGEGSTATLDSGGHIVLTANQGGVANMTMALANQTATPDAGTQFTNFSQTVAGAAGGSATTSIQVYDTQGAAHTITFSFEKESASSWNVTAAMNPGDGTITGFGEDNTVTGLTFNENGSFQGVTGASTAEILASKSPYTVSGAPATTSTLLSSLDQTTGGAYGVGNMLQITGVDQNGSPIHPISLPMAGTTLGDVVNAINAAYTGATATLNADGVIELSSNTTGQSDLALSIQPASTNTGGSTAFSTMTEAQQGTNGDADITFQVGNLAGYGNTQTVKLSFGTPNSFSGLTQLGGGSSAAAIKQDGYAQGSLQSASVGQDGTVTGQFSNGLTEPLAQVAVATFTNPQGLQSTSNNYFSATTNSGTPVVAAPGSGSAGTIQSGSLESSNVDVSTEFTQLVAAERGYQINSQAFSASNQILEEVSSLLSPNG